MTQLPENIHQSSSRPITNLTLAELEYLIKKIVQQTLQENINDVLISKPSQAFLETFSSWKEHRNPEEIIDEIYNSRTLDKTEEQW